MKGPVGEVMEAVIVGTAVEVSSSMHTRMSQSMQTCVFKQLCRAGASSFRLLRLLPYEPAKGVWGA